MPYGAVRERLAAMSKGWTVSEETGSLSLDRPGATVASQAYPVLLFARGEHSADHMKVWFSTPATGGPAVAIERSILYRPLGSGPLVKDFVRDLVAMYGPPSSGPDAFYARIPGEVQADRYAWVFDASGRLPCDLRDCDLATTSASLTRLGDLERRLGQGSHVAVTATITTSTDDPSHVGGFVLVLEDVENEALTLREARTQLEAAAADMARGQGRTP